MEHIRDNSAKELTKMNDIIAKYYPGMLAAR